MSTPRARASTCESRTIGDQRETDQRKQYNAPSFDSFNNADDYDPSDSDNYTNKRSEEAGLGACKVWIPDRSPMKGAGASGGDIGANVLYRYENGTLTQTPLWAPATGRFPCGAAIEGVNDAPGDSCIGVHARLNVNTDGCSFPSGYEQS